MIRKSLVAAMAVYLVYLGILLKEASFLAPLGSLIWQDYAEAFLYFSLALVANLFAAIYALSRKLTLTDTGDMLSHLEKQLRGRTTISEELTARILERK
jgi:hypothetical protein